MQTASWEQVEADVKLGTFLVTVAAQAMIGHNRQAAIAFGEAALGPAAGSFAWAGELEELEQFDVSGNEFWRIARRCFDFVHDRTPLDQLETADMRDDTINVLGHFLSAVPTDSYLTPLGEHSDRFDDRHDRTDDFPLPSLLLAAVAKVALVDHLAGFPADDAFELGFAPFEIAALAGMGIASVRNVIGPGGNKPIRSRPSSDQYGVYGEPLDTLEWLAGRRGFDPGPLSPDWLRTAALRAVTPRHAGALLGYFAWTNRITTETLAARSGLSIDTVRAWTRGDIRHPDHAPALAAAAGIDPETYAAVVARCMGSPAALIPSNASKAASSMLSSLNSSLLRDPRVRPHPDRPAGGTKYISTFLNGRGEPLALDLGSGSRNAIWLPALVADRVDASAIERELYPADRPRNSNLNVPELRGKALVRFYPRTLDEARSVIDSFADR